jgi:Na+-driven multidrug efflux pump
VVALAFLALPEALVGIFSRDASVIESGASYLRVMAIAQITMGLEIVLEASLGGAGFTAQPMAWATLITFSRIPLAVWLAGALGVAGVWWAISVTAVARALAMAILWRGEAWEHRRL